MADSSINIGSIKVKVSDLETRTDGEVITWDSSGNPTTVGPGNATEVFTSNGPGNAPSFQSAGAILQSSFSAHNNALQNLVSGASTQVIFQVELFDTNADFAASRFTPTIAGKYLLTTSIAYQFTGVGNTKVATQVQIQVNGFACSVQLNVDADATVGSGGTSTNCLADFNGSTDFAEVFIIMSGAGTLDIKGEVSTIFSGFRIQE